MPTPTGRRLYLFNTAKSCGSHVKKFRDRLSMFAS